MTSDTPVIQRVQHGQQETDRSRVLPDRGHGQMQQGKARSHGDAQIHCCLRSSADRPGATQEFSPCPQEFTVLI